MTWDEFLHPMVRLCEYMKAPAMSEDQLKEYYGPLARTAPDDFDAAVSELVATFKPEFRHPFPLVPDFRDAIDTAISKRIDRQTENFHCEMCWGEGRYIENDGSAGQERFCTCPEGMKRKRLRQEYYSDHGTGYRAPKEIRHTPWKATERLPYKDPPEIEGGVSAVVAKAEQGMAANFEMDTGEEAWNDMLKSLKEKQEEEELLKTGDDVPM